MTENEHARVAALLRLFEQHGLEELIIEQNGFRLHLRRDGASPPPPPAPAVPSPAPAPPAPARKGRTVAVRAPLIGIFYVSPAPGVPPFVGIGDIVKEGQTVCIVEAMKVFNEIKSDWAGRVVAIPAGNGQLVQAGEPLVVLEFLQE
jgi:acetyl-CoA carboxylase biotin carboxyl carrier protein